MKSPFPGMDPYIEGCGYWRDFHGHLIEKIFDEVSVNLPEKYIARTNERSYIVLIETDDKADRHFEPDVKVTSLRETKSANKGSAAPAAVANGAPVSVRAFIEDDFVEKFIDIYEVEPERRLVTSIEVLSPSNKKKGSPGWKKYLRKRQALLLGKANLVEIDLVRGGTRMPMLDPLPDSPYYVLVAREDWAPVCKVWAAYFDKRLPTVPVPLSKPDADLTLDLQPLVDGIYARSRYAQSIDYSRPLKPSLTTAEAAWLQRRLTPAKAPSKRPRRRSP
jgi:Protein of unknown function (DUF4058)